MTVARKLAVALVALMLVGGFGAIGSISAADVTVHDGNVTITEQTDTIWIETNNTNATQTANLTATITGIDSDGNTTSELETFSFQAANDSVTIQESSVAFNATETPEANVVVTLDNTTVDESELSVQVGTFEKTDGTAGGGGFDFSSYSDMEIVLMVGGIGAVLWFVSKED